MTLHPEVQKRAQKEIDDVVGTDRLPTSTDRDRLPYCEAVMKEVFRWHPVVPLGLCGVVIKGCYAEPDCRYPACSFRRRYLRWVLHTEGKRHYPQHLVRSHHRALRDRR